VAIKMRVYRSVKVFKLPPPIQDHLIEVLVHRFHVGIGKAALLGKPLSFSGFKASPV
jgi:hypothetical protein